MQEMVGLIGLGEMGEGMARNILKNGYSVVVHDLRSERMTRLAQAGAEMANNPAEVADRCRWIVLVLPDGSVVQSVVLGEGGILDHLEEAHILIDCGTTHPTTTIDIHNEVRRQGARFIDAPVSGMKARADDGCLTMMAGGDPGAFAEVTPLLESMADNITYMGGSGNGQLTKILNNVLFNISIAAMSELLPLAVKLGLDPEKLQKVVSTGSGQSYGFDHFSELALSRDFQTGYAMDKARKDMDAVLEFAEEERVELVLAEAAMRTYEETLRSGFGAENKAAMVKVWEEKLGVLVRKQEDR